ncbi:Intradiol ring-cleavage dioxygenase [Rhexocercosporidium sp. MPI-PUGE-AT-0058]|nr:Intradiol ring-cleavage dioxygenase [Rhexocercosporidium sp. MPI-PUGE-AT-0058]
MHFTPLIAASILASIALAHPGEYEPFASRSEIQKRGVMAKRYEGASAAMRSKRWNKRALETKAKRGLEARNTTFEIMTETPYYDVLQNDTCVLAPTVTEGPYVWPRSQMPRQDMTEDQPGIPFTLDVGVLDMTTCEPLQNVLVDFWHCNATGSYSSFTKLSPDPPFATLLQQMNITDFEIGKTDLHTDTTTFLRGMWPTDSDGAHTYWVLAPNGIISAGNRVSTGQIYIPDDIALELMAVEPYASRTTINRTTNADDYVFGQGFANGYNPVIDLVAADGVDMANGVIGYITIGINTTDV